MSRNVSQFERHAAPPSTESPAVATACRGILDDSPIASRWTGSPANSSSGTKTPPAPVGAATGSRAVTRFVVPSLLTIHAGLLAWQAYRYSPTVDEPAHMAAGISHWKFGRFDLYRVNPPLVRMVAALPMLVVDPKVDWSAFSEAPYARPEFAVGSKLANGNGFDIFWDFTLTRWTCIPFCLAGGYFCYRWALELLRCLRWLDGAYSVVLLPQYPCQRCPRHPRCGCRRFGRHGWLLLLAVAPRPAWPTAFNAGRCLGFAQLKKTTY